MSGRLPGCALILLAGLWLALQLCEALRRRLDTLWELDLALGLMQSELETSVRPTGELCALLAARCGGETGAFFRTLSASLTTLGERRFDELWTAALAAELHALSREDRRCLERLGQSLGRYELDRQLGALALCREQLRRSYEQGRAALPTQRRLTLGLSLAGAALLLIVLV